MNAYFDNIWKHKFQRVKKYDLLESFDRIELHTILNKIRKLILT